MNKAHSFSRLISMMMVISLLFSFLIPVRAAEPTDAAAAPTETAPAETTVPEITELPQSPETLPMPTAPETTAPTEAPETLPAETFPVMIPAETVPVQTEAAVLTVSKPEPAFQAPYELYFGLLHAHTDISDGIGSVEEAFSYAANVEGLDFFAVTDHSNSFDNADSGAIGTDGSALSTEWAAGKAAAAAVTSEDFVGIFGYEMTFQESKNLGHICTFNTPGWESRDQDRYDDQPTALETYYKALTTVPGSVSQFCHPGTFYGEFENFAHYSAAYDEGLHLLEVSGEGETTAYDYYNKALDAGWHVAPSISQNNHNGLWGDANASRTVVLAETLTEQNLYDAIQNYRVYATEDSDFSIYYELDGHPMGSILSRADDPSVTVSLFDPTDEAVGTVEVIVDGGIAAASRTVEGGFASVTIPVPAGYRYYYLKITQPDGDIAVTAPVWVEGFEDMGISGFTADTEVPVQDQAINLTLTLFNEEPVEFSLHSIQVFADGQLVHSAENPGTAKARGSFSYTVPYTYPDAGTAEFRAVVQGSVRGESRTYEQTLPLRFRSGVMVSGMLVDGSHGNAGLDSLGNLKVLAAEAQTDVTVFTGEIPRGGELLLITPPRETFEDTFLEDVVSFVEDGGSLILCGSAGDNTQLNRLLDAVGATLRLNSSSASEEDVLFSAEVNRASSWCAGITEEQLYSQHGGCTVDPGSGTWLVTAEDAVLLACEELSCGGTVFVAGGLFLSDEDMPEPKNYWDPPRISRTIAETLLDIHRTALATASISDIRGGTARELYQAAGYVTAGTSNKYTTFPDTLYLQDDTGGIAVIPFRDTGIQIGAPMEVIGVLREQDGNPVLELVDYRIPDKDYYRYVPRTMVHKTAMNYASHGGELLQVEGEVVSLQKTADGKGISRLVLKDVRGDLAAVEIEDCIRSSAYGTNTLAAKIREGRTVRAMGILHKNEKGETVLRVRNCDEVVYVPPEADPSNPKTGDPLGWLGRK